MSLLIGRRQLSGFLYAATLTPSTSASTASAYLLNSVRFATKKAAGSTKNGRDSIGKRLGVKILGDQKCTHGNILIRQRGLTYGVGENVGLGKDYTIYAMMDGWVQFTRDLKKKKTIVNVTDVDPRIKLGHVKACSSSSSSNSGSSDKSNSNSSSSGSESSKKVSNAI